MDDPNLFTAPISPIFSGKQPKQKCLEWIERHGYHTPIFTRNVFAYQSGGLTPMLRMIAATNVSERYFYEVVPPETPCKLFFDLDYKLSSGMMRKDQSRAMDQFIETVLTPAVRTVLRTSCGYEDLDALPPYILSADTSQKISRHIVFPDIVFTNIANIGEFVKIIKRSCFAATLSHSIDSGVYTRWRNFRLVGSTKKGKANHLILLGKHRGLGLLQQMLRTMLTITTNYKTVVPCKVCNDHMHRYKRAISCCPPHASNTNTTTIEAPTATMKVYNATPIGFPRSTDKIVEHIEKTVLRKQFPTHEFARTFQQFNGHCFVDYVISPGVPCPFNGSKSHKSNKTYFKIDLTCNVCFFRCADPACSKERFGLMYDVKRTCGDVGIHRSGKRKRPESERRTF